MKIKAVAKIKHDDDKITKEIHMEAKYDIIKVQYRSYKLCENVLIITKEIQSFLKEAYL